MNLTIAPQQHQTLKTPRAAGVAGILFAVLFASSIIAVRLAVPQDLSSGTEWLTAGRQRVAVALTLMPFAGIAFLWFVGVIRDLLGDFEDRFFASVYFGSSLLFVAMTFVATAIGGGLIASYEFDQSRAVVLNSDVILFGRAVALQISNVYAMRMAGVFMISLATVWLRTRLVPRWLTIVTYALAAVFLVVLSYSLWVTLIFPAWALLVSLYVLMTSKERAPG